MKLKVVCKRQMSKSSIVLLSAALIIFASFETRADTAGMEKRATEWAAFQKKYGTWPSDVSFPTSAANEAELLEVFKSERHGRLDHAYANQKDRLALDFMNAARLGFVSCGIDQQLKVTSPPAWEFYNRHLLDIRVISVPFNLCPDDHSSCSFSSSFTAKNFPALKLIIVNAFKWNTVDQGTRMSIAIHEVLGLAGVETGTYGYSSESRFVRVLTGNRCWFCKNPICLRYHARLT